MGTHMKTTIEISDALLAEAKRAARRDGTTVRALVEQGLRQVVAQRRARGAFKLKRASFKGKGLQPKVAGATWDRLREMAYEGRS
jgi:Arc/MetJ family transcription regulator